MRKYPVEIPNEEFYRRQIKCQYACPVRTDSGGYVQRIALGDTLGAYAVARRPNPFASTCGRVCGAPCESACRRGSFDAPITIRALKRFATERHGVEAHLSNPARALDVVYETGWRGEQPRREKVAVVGAGPAGLACAHDLARMGYQVTVFEAQPVAGGMLNLGVPEYRLPREVVNAEIEAVKSLGVDIVLGAALGRDFSLRDLKEQGYQAVFLACGATKSRDLRIPGVELDGVLKGVEFLLNVNRGFRVELGRRVIVVGGGNVAVDVARTALRHGLDIEGYRTALRMGEIRDGLGVEERSLAVDVARLALRRGAEEVAMVCLEKREEMPAHEWEVEDALAEGIQLFPSLGPKRILGKNGKVTGLETIVCTSVFDTTGRFNPSFAEGTESVMECDTVILAIGQAPDLSWVKPEDGIEITRRGTIAIDEETLATSAPGVFAGGDVAFGPRLIIDAVADGKKAALSIARYLGSRYRLRSTLRLTQVDPHPPHPAYDRLPRCNPPALPTDRRIGMAEVELGYDEEAAREQAMRCLRCHLNVVYQSDKCILCGGCVDICPYNCLRFVPLHWLEEDEDVRMLAEAWAGMPVDSLESLSPPPAGGGTAALVMDADKCIRCGLCVQRCPTGALSLVRFEFVEELSDASGETTIPERIVARVEA